MLLNSSTAKYISVAVVVTDNFHVEPLGVHRSRPFWQK